jgi:hypothetical protein
MEDIIGLVDIKQIAFYNQPDSISIQ